MPKIPDKTLDKKFLANEKLSDKDWKTLVNRQLKQVHRDTISMWNCAEAGRMPPSHSVNSFGIDTDEQILAIQWSIENMKIIPAQLEEVKKSGPAITALIVTKDNPYKVEFITLWDM